MVSHTAVATVCGAHVQTAFSPSSTKSPPFLAGGVARHASSASNAKVVEGTLAINVDSARISVGIARISVGVSSPGVVASVRAPSSSVATLSTVDKYVTLLAVFVVFVRRCDDNNSVSVKK